VANLQVDIAGVAFKNPLIAASGTFGFGREFAEFYPLSTFGGICTKGLTLEPRDGNPPPRIAETPGGDAQFRRSAKSGGGAFHSGRFAVA
jgi:dihydroorotate dehydrogenase (NAD+) catalytic subunit